jgi:hypothetical protein
MKRDASLLCAQAGNRDTTVSGLGVYEGGKHELFKLASINSMQSFITGGFYNWLTG